MNILPYEMKRAHWRGTWHAIRRFRERSIEIGEPKLWQRASGPGCFQFALPPYGTTSCSRNLLRPSGGPESTSIPYDSTKRRTMPTRSDGATPASCFRKTRARLEQRKQGHHKGDRDVTDVESSRCGLLPKALRFVCEA